MENFNNTSKRSVDASPASAPVSSSAAGTSNPLKKVVIALVALLIVGVGTFAFLNLSKERPPELQLASGENGLKGSFVETSQNLLQFEQYDKDAFAINKPSLAAKYSMAASTLPGVNYLFADSQISMADVVKGIDPVANRLLLAYYTPGEGNLTEGFYTYPKGPFNATHEISQAALTSFMIPQNRVVVVISEMAASSYGLLNGTAKPSAMWTSAPLADTNSGWVLVASKEASLAALTASYKDRVISAFALNGQETFQQVDPATYSLSSNSVVWLHLRPKVTITGGTTGGTETVVVVTPSLTMQTGLTLKAGEQLAVNLVGSNLTGGVTVTDPSVDSKLVISGKKVGADGKSFAFIVNALDSAPAATPFNLTITTADNVAHIQPITVTAKPVDGTLAPLAFTEPVANTSIALATIPSTGLHFTATNSNDVTKSTLVGTNGTHYFGYRWVLTNDATTTVWGTSTKWTDSSKFPVGTDCSTALPLGGLSADVWTCASGTIPLSAFQGTTKDAVYTLTGAAFDGTKTTVDASVKFTVTVPVAVPGTLNAPTGLAPNATTAAVDLTKNLSLTWAAPQSTDMVSYVWKLAKGKVDAAQFATTPNTLWELTKAYGAGTGGVNEQDATCYVGRKWSCTNLTIGQALRTTMATTPGDFTWGVQAYTSGTTPLTSAWTITSFTTVAAAPVVVSTDAIGSEVLALAPTKGDGLSKDTSYTGTEYQWFKGKILNIGTLHDVKLSEGPKTMVYLTKNHTALLNTPASLKVGQAIIAKGRNFADGTYWSAHITKVDGANYSYTYDDEIAKSGSAAKTEVKTIDNFFVPLSGEKIDEITGDSGIQLKTGSDAPSKIIFTAPEAGAEYALADLQKSGLDFTANDSNATSFNLASDGQYYMGYTWKLTSEDGGTSYWDSTETGASGSLPLYLDTSSSTVISPVFQNLNYGNILKAYGGTSALGSYQAIKETGLSRINAISGINQTTITQQRANIVNPTYQSALYATMNTCTKTVSNKSMWVCPNGTIPKKFFTAMPEGTKLTLTGTVSDGTKSAEQTVKFSVKGGANGINLKTEPSVPKKITGIKIASTPLTANTLKMIGLIAIADDPNNYAMENNKGSDGNYYMNYEWKLYNDTKKVMIYDVDWWSNSFPENPPCTKPIPGNWVCKTVKVPAASFNDQNIADGDSLTLSVNVGDGAADPGYFDMKFTLGTQTDAPEGAKTGSINEKILADLKNLKISVEPGIVTDKNISELNPGSQSTIAVGNKTVILKISADDLDGVLYNPNKDGAVTNISLAVKFDGIDVSPTVSGIFFNNVNHLKEDGLQYHSNITIEDIDSNLGTKKDGKVIPCMYWNDDGKNLSVCHLIDRYIPVTKAGAINSMRTVFLPFDAGSHTVEISLYKGTDSSRIMVEGYPKTLPYNWPAITTSTVTIGKYEIGCVGNPCTQWPVTQTLSVKSGEPMNTPLYIVRVYDSTGKELGSQSMDKLTNKLSWAVDSVTTYVNLAGVPGFAQATGASVFKGPGAGTLIGSAAIPSK